MKTFKLLVLATVLAVSPACKKKEEPKTDNTPSGSAMGSGATEGSGSAAAKPTEGSGSAMAGSGEGSGSAMAAGSGSAGPAAAEANTDYIEVVAHHEPAKPTDPVKLRFEKFKVAKATFDPKKLEGGKVTLEVDLSSLKTDSDKRDEHLKSVSYFDIAKFATMTIDIDKVKKKDDTHYTAEATVKLHGVTKKYPIAFEVVETKDDSVKVKGEQKLSRNDFKIGKPKTGKDELVATDMTVNVLLTIKKT